MRHVVIDHADLVGPEQVSAKREDRRWSAGRRPPIRDRPAVRSVSSSALINRAMQERDLVRLAFLHEKTEEAEAAPA
jgi:hypothetical protein